MTTNLSTTIRSLLAAVFWVGAMFIAPMAMAQTTGTGAAAGKALPGDSIYQLAATLTDQDGHSFQWADRRGQPTLVSMFYNTCKFVCPMLIDTMELTQQGLNAQERAQLKLMLITFDPARDDVKALKTITETRILDTRQWTLARTDVSSVRKIAATLGIQYRLLADGEYNHTTVLVLLDADGRIAGRTKRIGGADAAFIQLVKKTLQANYRAPS